MTAGRSGLGDGQVGSRADDVLRLVRGVVATIRVRRGRRGADQFRIDGGLVLDHRAVSDVLRHAHAELNGSIRARRQDAIGGVRRTVKLVVVKRRKNLTSQARAAAGVTTTPMGKKVGSSSVPAGMSSRT